MVTGEHRCKCLGPIVTLAHLQAILTGCSYKETSRDQRSGKLLSDPQDAVAFVVGLTDTLTAALAAPPHEGFPRFAEPWSKSW